MHAMNAKASIGMDCGIIEKDPVAACGQLLPDHKFFVRTPIRIAHEGRLIIAAIPRFKNVPATIHLTPLGRRGFETPAKLLGPVAIKAVQLDDGSRANVADGHMNAALFSALEIFGDALL